MANRLRLMKEHLKEVDADVIGMSEVDGLSGEFAEAYIGLIKMM